MLLAISIMTFAFINLAPGDPVDAMIDPEFFVGGAGDKLRARLGLDKPIHERYLLWLIEVSPFSSSCDARDDTCETLSLARIPGTDSWPFPTDIIPTALNLKIWPPDVNFGYSYQFGVSVMSMIADRIVPTIELTIVSLLAATVIGTGPRSIPGPPPIQLHRLFVQRGRALRVLHSYLLFRSARALYIRCDTWVVPVLWHA